MIEPHLPTDVPGKERADDRRIISGILHALKSGCPLKDCHRNAIHRRTVYNRFVHPAERGVRGRLFRDLTVRGRSDDTHMIDSTHIKGRLSASGEKGGAETGNRSLARRAQRKKFPQPQVLSWLSGFVARRTNVWSGEDAAGGRRFL